MFYMLIDISDTYVKELGRTKEAAEKIIEECIERNILRDYMEKHRGESESIMDLLFDEETINRIHDKVVAKEAREEGIQQGMIDILVRQFKDKKISANDGANYLGISVNEFLDLVGVK